ncbi:MAG: hypothetical protein RLZZ451_2399, partial [Pseudomonadota bacterium]
QVQRIERSFASAQELKRLRNEVGAQLAAPSAA